MRRLVMFAILALGCGSSPLRQHGLDGGGGSAGATGVPGTDTAAIPADAQAPDVPPLGGAGAGGQTQGGGALGTGGATGTGGVVGSGGIVLLGGTGGTIRTGGVAGSGGIVLLGGAGATISTGGVVGSGGIVLLGGTGGTIGSGGVATGGVVLLGGAGGTIGTGGVSSTGGGAVLTVSVGSVDLGAFDVGTTSSPRAVTVTNIGTQVSGTLSVVPSGAGISAIGCTGTLAPAATCTLTITATAMVAGPFSGSVAISEGTSAPRYVSVSGLATTPGQMLTLSPGALDLGTVLIGARATGTVLVTNPTFLDVSNIFVTVTGTGFSLDAATTTCTATLAVGKNCNIGVTFTAATGATAGKATGILQVAVGGEARVVSLTATVQAPQSPAKLAIVPPSAAFSSAVGSTSAAVPFHVTNTGDVASGIPNVTLIGPNAVDFSIVSSTCITALAGGQTTACEIDVVYVPTASATTEVAALLVEDPGPGGSSATAALTGYATTPGNLILTGGPDLGPVLVGVTGTAVTFTVTNNGGGNSGMVTVATSDSGRFLISADNCTGRDLKNGDTCTFAVQFKPAAGDYGVVSGSVSATGAATGVPVVLNVDGTAEHHPTPANAVTFAGGKAEGAMTGYAWVALGSADTISDPTCGGTSITNAAPCATLPTWSSSTALCISGSIPALAPTNPDYAGNPGISVGVNADAMGGTLGQSFSSMTIALTGSPGSGLRAMLHKKGDSEATFYCLAVTSGPMTFTSFNTKCFDTPPDGVALTAADVPNIDKISVQVASTSSPITVSNLCITGITFAN